MRSLPAVVLVATLLQLWNSTIVPAAETIIVTEDAGAAGLEMGSADGCGCRDA